MRVIFYITVDSKAIKLKNLTNAKESKLTNMVITLYQPYENQNRSRCNRVNKSASLLANL